MTTLVTRSAIKYWSGQEPPPDLAYRVSTGREHQQFRDVTWAEVMQNRRERQEKRLSWIREGLGQRQLRAVRITSRYFDRDFYGGWHVYMDGVSFSHWVRNGDYGFARSLMELLPLADTWKDWKEVFANTYPCGEFNGRPRGMIYGWAEMNGTSPSRLHSIIAAKQIELEEKSMPKKKVETDVGQENSHRQVVDVPIEEILDSPFQPRKTRDAEADAELTESIRVHGVRNPLLLRATLLGPELVGGQRRRDCARTAGLTIVPGIIYHNMTDKEAAELAIIDNVQRQQISLLDEALAYKRLRDEFEYSADDIHGKVHRSKTAIYDALRVADLPKHIIELVSDGDLHYSHAVALTGAASDEAKLQEFTDDAVRFGYTAKQVESEVQEWKEQLEREAAEREAREKPPLPLETDGDESTPEADSTPAEEAAATDTNDTASSEPAKEEKSTTTETTTTKTMTSTPSSTPKATTTPAATPAPAPVAPKAPEGMISTFVPKDDCLYCQDAGLTMQEIFALVRRMIELGKPKGLSPDDVLATTESLLND